MELKVPQYLDLRNLLIAVGIPTAGQCLAVGETVILMAPHFYPH